MPARPAFALAGVLNGSLGLFVGATGLFVGRLFFWPDWRKETVIGTLAMTQTLGHGLRVLAYGLIGFSALDAPRSEENTSELQSLIRITYAVFGLQKQNTI